MGKLIIIFVLITGMGFAQTNQILINFTDATSVNSALIKADINNLMQ